LSWEGTRDAKAFGPIAIQTVGAGFRLRETEQSEDCLTLNVWTGTLDGAAGRPVMVWIHGGGNLGGAGSEDAFDGASLARRGVVLVTFNYRLGALGFLAHPTMGTNFAVTDWVAALRWVRANAVAFGGDSDNVTVFGESAGAVAVRTLLSSPPARGLFHRAVIQSAGFEPYAFTPNWTYERTAGVAETFFDRLSTRDPDELRCLPIADVKLASHECSGIFPKAGHVHTPANLVWVAVPDGETVATDGFPGWPDEVPVMFGCLENEARYFIKPGGSYPPGLLRNMAEQLCGPRNGELMSLFEASGNTPYEALDRLFTTVIWHEPAMASVKRFAALGRRFFYYHFARAAPGAVANGDLVRHSAEIRYVFGNLTDDGHYDDVDQVVSEGMQSAWIAFARDGIPRGPAGPWPAYAAPEPEMTWIGDAIETRPFEVAEVTAIVHSLREPSSRPT
jgi:para-nitrobenzyl esterase